jgi:two-component system chemotaxis response regulator CheB
LSTLPVDFPLPTLIVQHMPPLFTPLLAQHLSKDTGRHCQEAVDGDAIQPGWTYVSPGDFHLALKRQGECIVTRLNQEPREHFCRPSVNPLFRSAAQCYGSSVLAVMLTGMGEDGIEGTRCIVEKQGHVIAQDRESSVVWGMPGAVVRDNLANKVLPLNEIGLEIIRLCLKPASVS